MEHFRPYRGNKSTAEQQNIVLQKGELFFETPEEGTSTAGKIKMGDGVTEYSDLPYFINPENAGVYLTQAEYDALPDTKLTDGINYYITDADGYEDMINDDTVSDATTWSSEKISGRFDELIWTGTQAEYDAIAVKSDNTIYLIKG